MGGGTLQLVAYGSQDIYLTGNPQITFFKIVYRRHTNFSMELIEQTLNGDVGQDNTQSCIVSKNGDLMMDTWISINSLSSTYNGGEIYDFIDNVEILIGGQQIDKQHSDWNAIWWNLTTPDSKVNGLRNMFTGISGAVDAADTTNTLNSYMYYPLNFWFCRNPGLALPLIALQYHNVEFRITWGSSSAAIAGTSPEVWINYVFLDNDERRRFSQQSQEYLIEQVQRLTYAGNDSDFDLNFNHPVKEIFWVNDVSSSPSGSTTSFAPIRCTANCVNSAKSTTYASDSNGPGPYQAADATKCKITLNGNDRFSYKEMKYFKICQPIKHHTRVPLGKTFTVTTTCDQYTFIDAGAIIYYVTKPVRLLSCSFITSTAISGTGSINLQSNAIVSGTINHSDNLEMLAPALAIGATTTCVVQSFTLYNTEVVCLPAGKIIILNGLDSSSGKGVVTMEFEELPLLISGNTHDLANIYCYSFALKPEEHQPSGSCNFTRINDAKLRFDGNNVADKFGAGSGTVSTLKIFALNYNVLRIMSGMGGLAYSN